MTLRLDHFDIGCETEAARKRNDALNIDDFVETVENERKRSCESKVKNTVGKMPDKYTMKIVVTMTVDAHNREQAEVLAGHVAAFLPEDAERVAEAFTPVIMAPRSGDKRGGSTQKRARMATAEVIMVHNRASDNVVSSRTEDGSKRAFAAPLSQTLPLSSPHVSVGSPRRRTSIYTRATSVG